MAALEKIRIDKWLWAARFFKTRSQASDIVQKNKVQINRQICKPSREVHVGDLVRFEKDHLQWEVEVLGISDLRGAAPVAQQLYAETPASIAAREAEQARRKIFQEPAAQLHGRPTKRDRRAIGRLS